MGTFLHVLSEQYRTEHFFVAERSVLTEHLDLMFPRTLDCSERPIYETTETGIGSVRLDSTR